MGKDGLSACCKTLDSNLRNSFYISLIIRSFSQFQKDFSGLLVKNKERKKNNFYEELSYEKLSKVFC